MAQMKKTTMKSENENDSVARVKGEDAGCKESTLCSNMNLLHIAHAHGGSNSPRSSSSGSSAAREKMHRLGRSASNIPTIRHYPIPRISLLS